MTFTSAEPTLFFLCFTKFSTLKKRWSSIKKALGMLALVETNVNVSKAMMRLKQFHHSPAHKFTAKRNQTEEHVYPTQSNFYQNMKNPCTNSEGLLCHVTFESTETAFSFATIDVWWPKFGSATFQWQSDKNYLLSARQMLRRSINSNWLDSVRNNVDLLIKIISWMILYMEQVEKQCASLELSINLN